jgi:hypothetical protein
MEVAPWRRGEAVAARAVDWRKWRRFMGISDFGLRRG